MTAGLTFADVACVRGGRLLFEEVTFALAPGEAALVSGPNGTGKSSLIRIAAGLLPAAAGRVDGEGARAMLAETAALDPELNVAAALRFWARIDGRADAVEDALAAVGLAALAQVPVRVLEMLIAEHRAGGGIALVATHLPIALPDAVEIAL